MSKILRRKLSSLDPGCTASDLLNGAPHKQETTQQAQDGRMFLESLLRDEIEYGKTINCLYNHFYKGILNNKKLVEKIGRDGADLIFYRIEEVKDINNALVVALQHGLTNWPKESISSIFLRMVRDFETLNLLVKSYSCSLNTLRNAKKSRNCQAFIKTTEEKYGEVARLLTAPHHRIEKYSEFLSAFCQFDKENEEAKEEAVVAINKLLFAQEESKRYSRAQGKLMDLEMKLEIPPLWAAEKFQLALPHRSLLREGIVYSTSTGSTKPSPEEETHCFLCNDLVLYTVKMKTSKEMYKAQRIIYLYDIKRVEALGGNEDEKKGFYLVTNEEKLVFLTSSVQEAKAWIENINYYAQEAKASKVFGVPLEEVIERERAKGEDRAVPLIVEQIVQSLRSSPQAMKTEGIFRIAGSSSHIQTLSTSIDAGGAVLYGSQDVHVTAGLLKLWMRSLPEPLLTFELYDSFIQAVKATNDNVGASVAALKEVVCQLPIYNKFTLHYLITFLHEISTFSKDNKMVSNNLAIVFAPNMLIKRGVAFSKDPSEFSLAQAVIKHLIDHHERIFAGTEEEKRQFLAEMRLLHAEINADHSSCEDEIMSHMKRMNQASERDPCNAKSGNAGQPVRRMGPMSLDVSNPEIARAYHEIRTDSSGINYVVLGYDSPTTIKVDAKGTGGVKEAVKYLQDTEVQYAMLKGKYRLTSIRYLMLRR